MSKDTQTEQGNASAGNDKPEARSKQRISSHTLLAGCNRLWIEHDGVDYQLQVTRQGKLILTK